MAGAYYDLTAANAALKELYDGQTIDNEVYEDAPLWVMLKKETNFYGADWPCPIITGVSQGVSADFATAQANQSPPQVNSFKLVRKRRYSLGTIDNETMLASANDAGAFIEGAKLVVDSATRAAMLALQSDLFRAGTGSICQVNASGWTTGVATLQNLADIVQIEINMVLQANATDGGASPRAALGYVVAVDRVAGTVTVASSGLGGSAATPSGWSGSDFLLRQGDNNATASGLSAWFPDQSNRPTSSDSFYGVNRSVDSVRFAGSYFDGRNEAVEEAWVDGLTIAGREGGRPTLGVTSFGTFGAAEKALGAKAVYPMNAKLPDGTEIGFRGLRVTAGNTEAVVFPDRSCPVGHTWFLTPKACGIKSLGELPQILRYEDGLSMLRVSNKDAGELRVGGYWNFYSKAPAWCNVTTTSV